MNMITEAEGEDGRENYFLSLPPGYRFAPTDAELVVHYLYNKVSHKPLPSNRIRDVNIYLFHPQQLAGMYPLLRETHWYFFTPTERKHSNGVRQKRVTSDGYWKATVNKHVIYENKIVGYKMSLDFYEGGPRDGRKTEWKMHEYRILKKSPRPTGNSNAANNMKLDDWVLCKIYSNSKKAKDIQENQRTELAAENANQDSSPFCASNVLNIETPSSSNLLPPNSEWNRFILTPPDDHHMPLVGPCPSFYKLSGVEIPNPSLLSSGDNDKLDKLIYFEDLIDLEGVINCSTNDNCASSLGAYMMNIEKQNSLNPSTSFSELSGVQIPNPSLLSSGDNDKLDTTHDNCQSSLGAHMMNIEERSSPNLLPHDSEWQLFMLEPVVDHRSTMAGPSTIV